MKIRILGNSASGKTTLANEISSALQINKLHIDGIAFIANTNFQMKPKENIRKELIDFLANSDDYVIDGNYFSLTDDILINPTHIIFINLPVDISLANFEKRYIDFKGKSRPELPGCIEDSNGRVEMIKWIKSFDERKHEIENFLDNNHSAKVIEIKSMSELENFKSDIISNLS